jgi:phosphorylcholine metabolism protein LicD
MKEEIRKYREKKKNQYPTHYSLKYNIPSVQKTHKELMESIYRFEMKNINRLIQNGLDPITKEYGYYLIS